MDIQENIRLSETKQQRIVFKDSLNDQGNLFGGSALKWMDEVAYITATKFTRQKMVTVSVEKIKFREPISESTLIEVRGKVISAGNVKLMIEVEIWKNEINEIKSIKAIEGRFIFAAVDESGKPVKLCQKLI